MVDVFDTEQSKRLFGFIAAGATLGGIVGSSLTAALAKDVPATYLLLVSALLLELAVFSVRRLSRLSDALHRRPAARVDEPPIGGSILSGVIHAFKSPYLANRRRVHFALYHYVHVSLFPAGRDRQAGLSPTAARARRSLLASICGSTFLRWARSSF